MSPDTHILAAPLIKPDYSLTGVNSALAVERGLAEADWYQCAVPRETLRGLLERRDGPAIRDTLLWFALILGCLLYTSASIASGIPAARYGCVEVRPIMVFS